MDSDEEKCPVCLKELGDKGIFITKCGHTFCGACIFANLSYTNKCPLCRQIIMEETVEDNSSPVSTPSEVPERQDVISIYTDLIMQQVQNDTSEVNHEFLRAEILNLLHGFEMDLRLVQSPLPAPRSRPLSVSDLPYNLAPYMDQVDDNEADYDSVDEIIANLDIPEN
jgi:hypothetical protein